MFNKLKQYKDLRAQAKNLQNKLAQESVTTNSAGGKVVLTMNGNLSLTGLAIDDELMTLDKKEKLQNAVKEAHEDAVKKIQRIMAMKVKESGGLKNIPSL